jgi:hypothetical protein
MEPREFRSEWNAGAGIMLYNGHGSTTTLSNVRYFSTWSVDSLSNRDRLSVCFLGACNQRFEPRAPSSIPVRLLESASGGAVAVVGPGGFSYEDQNSVFFQALFAKMTGEPRHRLGDCFRDAMSGLLFGAWMDSVVHRMNYLGDPALTVKRGTEALAIKHGGNEQPRTLELMQNYPNPFNPVTTIKYTVEGVRGQGPGVSKTSLNVYDVLGRQVATLVDEVKAPGSYEARFDGTGLSSGVYFYRLTAGAFVQSRTMLLIK